MKFSQRKGFKSVSNKIQAEYMNDVLRNSLWNLLQKFIFNKPGFLYHQDYPVMGKISTFSWLLWSEYFKKPVDERPDEPKHIFDKIRDYYFNCNWFEVYDLIEFIIRETEYSTDEIISEINTILERELAGYRLIEKTITDITDSKEVEALEEALSDDRFSSVSKHLQTSLDLLSRKVNPDYRNSIKESISAVESMVQIITGSTNNSLGDALKQLDEDIHPSILASFTKLYGYTSNEEGIRHAMIDEPNIIAADAKFLLLSCTSFINYLKAKMVE